MKLLKVVSCCMKEAKQVAAERARSDQDQLEALSNHNLWIRDITSSPYRITSHCSLDYTTSATVAQRQVIDDAINTKMNSRVASASDLAFLNQPYHPVYSPFAAKPVLVHQYANSISRGESEYFVLTIIFKTQHLRQPCLRRTPFTRASALRQQRLRCTRSLRCRAKYVTILLIKTEIYTQNF